MPGLRFIPDEYEYYRDHANVDDKLYDPARWLRCFLPMETARYRGLCRMNGITPAIHLSLMERIAHGTEDYSPGNLPADARIVITPTGDQEKDATALTRALAAEGILKSAHANTKSSLVELCPRHDQRGPALLLYLFVVLRRRVDRRIGGASMTPQGSAYGRSPRA